VLFDSQLTESNAISLLLVRAQTQSEVSRELELVAPHFSDLSDQVIFLETRMATEVLCHPSLKIEGQH
jgi:hypothetical protein